MEAETTRHRSPRLRCRDMRAMPLWCAAAVAVTLVLSATAGEPTTAEVADSVRRNPEGAEPALRWLDRRGAEGWKALARVVEDVAPRSPAAASAAACVLAGGASAARLEIVVGTYRRVADESVRAGLALGLAARPAEYGPILEMRLRNGLPGAGALLTRCAQAGISDETLDRCLEVPSTALEAYAALRARGRQPPRERSRLAARRVAALGLDPPRCRAFAEGAPDFDLLDAIAGLLGDEDEDVRVGAHALLQTASGIAQPPDPGIWRSWVAARRDRPLAPDPASPGAIAAAVARGARFLCRDLAAEGRCLWLGNQGDDTAIGSTALAVLALRAAGVPAGDPAIAKALEATLLVPGRRGGPPGLPEIPKASEVYNASLLVLALHAVDPAAYREPIGILARRLAYGQLANGRWTYKTGWGTDAAPKHDGDNSNTQYAVLALRAAAAAGAGIDRPLWERNAGFWRATVNDSGGWGYTGRTPQSQRVISMAATGVASLAICLEQLRGNEAMAAVAVEPVLQRALANLGRLLVVRPLGREELYALYAVERACVLTGTRAFKAGDLVFDWYRQGAILLLGTQNADGSWGTPAATNQVDGTGYGPEIDTAYALLFLKRATTPIGAREGDGVVEAQLRKGDKPLPLLEATRAPVQARPPARPALEPDRAVFTSAGESVVVTGTMRLAGAELAIDGSPTRPDEEGRFAAVVPVGGGRDVAIVATTPAGEATSVQVRVELDSVPPKVALEGPARRGPGRRVLVLRADEPLSHVVVGNDIRCADGTAVAIALDLEPGRKSLQATAVDLAGNETKVRLDLEIVNRALVLDGKSALGLSLADHPAAFTLEGWARCDSAEGPMAVAADTAMSGLGIFWRDKGRPTPTGWVYVRDRGYLVPSARASPPEGRWTHLALSYDGATARFFVSGKLQESLPGGPRVTNRKTFFIGAEPGDGPERLFVGALDDIHFSSIARYESSFTPPKYAAPDEHTVFLLDFDGEEPFRDAGPRRHAVTAKGSPEIRNADRPERP